MSKVTVTKNGVTQEVKSRFLHNFIAQGWSVEGSKKVSTVGKANATADVIEEQMPLKPEVDEDASMPSNQEGEE